MKKEIEKFADKLVNAYKKNKLISPLPVKYTKNIKNATKLRKLCESKIKTKVVGFKAGGTALPVVCDIRFEEQVESAVTQAVEKFGGIDICINNASAIHLTDTINTPMKRYDLMHNINVRGTFMLSQKCIPHLKEGNNPHILTLSPPIDIDRKWFGLTLAYTTAKYGMSLVAHGLAEELQKYNIASNCLWPRTSLDTAAVRNVIGSELIKGSRKPSIYADAAYAVLKRESSTCTGNFFLDQDVLEEEGVTDFDKYAIDPEATLVSDFFVDDNPEDWIQAL